MSTLNDQVLDTILKRNVPKLVELITKNDLPCEASLLFRVNLPKATPIEDVAPPPESKELAGFYIRIDISDFDTVVKMILELYRRYPIETMGILNTAGKETHFSIAPLKREDTLGMKK